MVRFECDGCGTIKKNSETWILGFAAENIGVIAARREVTIARQWDDRSACEWLAVHFCSEECQAGYIERLFGDAPTTQTGAKTVKTKRIQRVVPGAVVETQVSENRRSVVATRRRKKAS